MGMSGGPIMGFLHDLKKLNSPQATYIPNETKNPHSYPDESFRPALTGG
jgi:hypothetical protein